MPGFLRTIDDVSPREATSEILGGTVLRQYFRYLTVANPSPAHVSIEIRQADGPAGQLIAAASKRLSQMVPSPPPKPVAGRSHTIIQSGMWAKVVSVQNGYAIGISVRFANRVAYSVFRRYDRDASPAKDALYYLDVIEKKMQGGK
jgi:hypothetical protein